MTDPMISTAGLAAMLEWGDPRIVDASWHLDARDAVEEYRASHIPGAVFFDIDAIADRSSPLPHMLPSPNDFADAVGKLGISEQDEIVVYDSAGLFSAARVWWTFRTMGAERVRVLDGGLPKWIAEGRPLEAGERDVQAATFQPKFRPELVRGLPDIRRDLGTGSAQVVDARPAGRFLGEAPEPRPGLRSGHMPGARSLPLGLLINADGTLKDVAALQTAFADAGVDPGRAVTASCGSGITAAGIALALARLGNEWAAIYDGSWAEWGALPELPVAVGPAGPTAG